ncbi:hypothetical protein [Candidatus Sulfurimonas baltica]|uniref:Uncharacterized protein n=1 Tax=Candidatus Sulfurimonas baltica TaxID=2740404 RepID=A0A7S7LX85_9BACT|nr:hypothetical protein [Candidatus Sulfurimonas baltica]QOY53199.1 hypothetical protein HUE88_05840 [Candidatus Sulfurimonas baltica]
MMPDITKYTKISEKNQKKACRWVCRQNNDVAYEVHKQQKKEYFALKAKFVDVDAILISLAAYIIAVSKIYNLFIAKSQKNKFENLKGINSSQKIRGASIKNQKKSPKRDQLLNKKSLLLDLIDNQGLSPYSVVIFLKKFNGFEVSHTTIRKVYKFLKEDV